MKKYTISCETTEGCGSRGQMYIDQAWDELQTFCITHPEFAKAMPRAKYQCKNDGAGGTNTGFAFGFLRR
jgi:hypothetical protein